MKINFSHPQNFKGYDALVLKALHIEESTSEPIREELKNIAKKENFELRQELDYFKWTQDFKTIIEQKGKPVVVVNNRVDENFLDEMKYRYGIQGKTLDLIATGGNSFIGKFPNGDKWMLIGESEFNTKSKKYISKEYEIKEENIFPIPQQYYHLDMFLRPIGFPYVLVDSPVLSEKKLASKDIRQGSYDYITLNKEFKYWEQNRSKNYDSHNDVIEALEKAGFKPIQIAGVFGSGINFMNAIINQHQDGTISYITNGTKCDSDFITSLQQDFEKELRQKVPNIRNVYFVNDDDSYTNEMSNYMMDNLAYRGGGIHCMSLEEPSFELWG